MIGPLSWIRKLKHHDATAGTHITMLVAAAVAAVVMGVCSIAQ